MKAPIRAAALATFACLALTACTVHQTETPAPVGPSDFALSARMEATPDAISLDGGSQSSIRVFANGPDGKPLNGVTFRVDTVVGGVAQDFGQLSARSIVTGSDGVARATYTAPAAPPNGQAGTCRGLPGTCVEIVATPSGTNFVAAGTQSVLIRLVPVGVILPPATTPSPCITLSPTSPSANITAQFTAGSMVSGSCTTANSDVVSFAWTFGDGASAAGRVVNHTFSASGSFVVTLTETSDRGMAASTTQQVSIGSPDLPRPTFSTSPGSPAVGDTIFFNASASLAGSGHTLTGFSWDFGDGTTGSGMNTTHIYSAARTYTVLLTVTDESGQSATSAPTSIGIGSGAPAAAFTFLLSGKTVAFDAGPSTAQPGSSITAWSWTFGDTTSGSGQTTSHTYVTSTTATFTVRLTVTDSLGRSGSTTQSVTVP